MYPGDAPPPARRRTSQQRGKALAATAKPPAAARALALDVLLAATRRNAPGIEDLLEVRKARYPLSPADLGLARELVSGVNRQRLWLEHVLAMYLERPLPEGARAVHESLLLGIYQALFLDRIPPHAIVDDAVRLVAMHRTEKGYQGLTNAILRRVASRDRAQLLPDERTPWPLRFSIPDWIAADAGQSLAGEDLPAAFSALNEPPPLHLRLTGDGVLASTDALLHSLESELAFAVGARVDVQRGRFLPTCVVVPAKGLAPDRLPSFRAGHLTAMDEAAQLVVAMCGARPGMTVLDACAAPGGKAAALWDAMGRRGVLTALDVTEQKLTRLRQTLRRLGLIADLRIGLAQDLLPAMEPATFDLVLLDAPCTGLGTLRRHPEIRWRRKPADMGGLVALQGELLERHAPLVRPGGHLIYAVCSFTREEGPRQVARFLARHGEFAPAPPPDSLPFDPGPLSIAPGVWRTLPHRDGCDAFVVARLRRRE